MSGPDCGSCGEHFLDCRGGLNEGLMEWISVKDRLPEEGERVLGATAALDLVTIINVDISRALRPLPELPYQVKSTLLKKLNTNPESFSIMIIRRAVQELDD